MNLPALKEQIRLAFDPVTIPPADALPTDFRIFAAGKHWAMLPTVGLFLHRSALPHLTPEALRAYIAAYMTGGLVDGPYEIDLLRVAMQEIPHLAEIDDAQRAAVAAFEAYGAAHLAEIGIRNYTRERPARQARQ